MSLFPFNFSSTCIFLVSFYLTQWLVKKAIETREELGDKIRLFSISQFQKSYSLPEDKEKEEKEEQALNAVKTFKVRNVLVADINK